MPPDPDMPCALQPPAMTNPFTRQLSPMMNRPSGVKVGQPLPTKPFLAPLAAGNSWDRLSSKLSSNSQSASTPEGAPPNGYVRGSRCRDWGSQHPSNNPPSRTRP